VSTFFDLKTPIFCCSIKQGQQERSHPKEKLTPLRIWSIFLPQRKPQSQLIFEGNLQQKEQNLENACFV